MCMMTMCGNNNVERSKRLRLHHLLHALLWSRHVCCTSLPPFREVDVATLYALCRRINTEGSLTRLPAWNSSRNVGLCETTPLEPGNLLCHHRQLHDQVKLASVDVPVRKAHDVALVFVTPVATATDCVGHHGLSSCLPSLFSSLCALTSVVAISAMGRLGPARSWQSWASVLPGKLK